MLKIERTPIVLQCNACTKTYEVEVTRLAEAVCPDC